MAPILIIDNYYLTITFLISLALQGSLFLISYTFQTDKFTDVGGSANFFILALFTLLAGNTFFTRNVLVSVLVMIWSLRLGGFLLYRVLKTGHDGRFDEMRSQFFKFMGFWAFQLFWVWIVSLPVTILNSPQVSDVTLGGGNVPFGTSRDIAGLIMWIIGFAIEVIGDQQKFNYKFSHPPKGSIMDSGIWKYTRHPNFFGEIFLWWGMWILCLSPALINSAVSTVASVVGGETGVVAAVASGVNYKGRNALYGAIVSPIFITLLLFFVSGLPLAEKPTAERYFLMSKGRTPLEGDKWGDYQKYLERTSILVPIPPSIYKPIPTIIKRTILLDWPMFQFDEAVDGKLALEKEEKKRSESSGGATV